MSSPVNIPFSTLIELDRSVDTPIYIQIARKLTHAIRHGILVPGAKLPGTRSMSELLDIHRKTVVAAYAELDSQGWIETLPNQGTFVTKKSMQVSSVPFAYDLGSYPKQTGFSFRQSMLLDRYSSASRRELEFSDGLPDVRLAPLEKLSKTYSSVLKRKNSKKHLGYSDVEGNEYFRTQLSSYLNNTRGLHIAKENIITTRGIQMGIYMASQLILSAGDLVVVGDLSYYVANMIFQQAGATILSVPVDQEGISVAAVRKLCEANRIRMLYLTPHHHYPTTVTLSAERRVALLNLSLEFGFVILEDDYDYDFHFDSSPFLPLASADASGMVVYVGSFCKTLAPGLRAGYIVAPENFIAELAKLRRILDRQGDMIMEQTLGELLDEGEIQRHLKKAQKVYHGRRDRFCSILENEFKDYLKYEIPAGGLAVWTEWERDVNLLKMSKDCLKKDLYLPQTLLFQTEKIRAVRLGFGNLDDLEMEKAMTILGEVVRNG